MGEELVKEILYRLMLNWSGLNDFLLQGSSFYCLCVIMCRALISGSVCWSHACNCKLRVKGSSAYVSTNVCIAERSVPFLIGFDGIKHILLLYLFSAFLPGIFTFYYNNQRFRLTCGLFLFCHNCQSLVGVLFEIIIFLSFQMFKTNRTKCFPTILKVIIVFTKNISNQDRKNRSKSDKNELVSDNREIMYQEDTYLVLNECGMLGEEHTGGKSRQEWTAGAR